MDVRGMDAGNLALAVETLFSATSTEASKTAANASLMEFQQSEDCVAVSLGVLAGRDDDARVLYFVAATLADSLLQFREDGSPGTLAILLQDGAQRASLLSLAVRRYNQGARSFAALGLALCRLFGRVAALFIGSDWASAVEDCVALSNMFLGLGALEHMAEAASKLPPKLSKRLVERMQANAVHLCRTCARAATANESAEPLQKSALKGVDLHVCMCLLLKTHSVGGGGG
jgi:hypothetical protein